MSRLRSRIERLERHSPGKPNIDIEALLRGEYPELLENRPPIDEIENIITNISELSVCDQINQNQ